MLSKAQKKYLRGLGHHLNPVVMIGDAGLSESIHEEFLSALDHHELIKVRVKVDNRGKRAALIDSLCAKGNADLVQRIGNMALIYRENPDKMKIHLPQR